MNQFARVIKTGFAQMECPPVRGMRSMACMGLAVECYAGFMLMLILTPVVIDGLLHDRHIIETDLAISREPCPPR